MLYVRISTSTSLRRQKWSYVYPGNSTITPVLWKVANGYTWKPWMPIRYFSRLIPPGQSQSKSQTDPFGNYTGGTYLNPYANMVKGYKEYATQPWWHSSSSNKSWFLHQRTRTESHVQYTTLFLFENKRQYTPYYYMIDVYDKRTTSIHWNPWTKEVWHWGTILLIKR